jgi:hypothetical protein
MHLRSVSSRIALAASLGVLLAACADDSDGGIVTPGPSVRPVALRNQSVTPALLKSLVPGVEIFSLVSSDDQLAGSPDFRFGGSADGAGLIRNPDGTFTLLTNHEDNFAVSRVRFDKDLKPTMGDYVVNSTAGRYRLCSATLATVEEHGFSAFLTAGESSEESEILAVDPSGPPTRRSTSPRSGASTPRTPCRFRRPRSPIGPWSSSATTTRAPRAARWRCTCRTPWATSTTAACTCWRVRTTTPRERDMVVGQSYPGAVPPDPNQKTLTGRQINQAGATLNAIRFARVEDLDYRKGSAANNREVYFVATGQNNTGVNADYGRTKYGRAYRLRLDASNPLQGTLEVIADGDDKSPTNAARLFQNPDNVYVGTNYVYLQEDDNGYGDETHDAYIYQYNIATRELKPVLEMDHRRTQPDAALYNAVGARPAGRPAGSTEP